MNKRQPFMTDGYYRAMLELCDGSPAFWSAQALDEDHPGQAQALRSYQCKQDAFEGVLLRYTAGEPVEVLMRPLEHLIGCYETYQADLARSEGVADVAPLNIDSCPSNFEECMQVFSLCILLQRTDLLARLVGLFDPAGFYAQDTLYESLLAPVMPGRADIDEWYHESYTDLIRAIYAADKGDASRLLKRYCDNWYNGFCGVGAKWHDSHLDIEDDDGSYYGYWAIEAAAVAYLYGIDDSTIDHMVYPRELVAYARHHGPAQ
ncbi:DUF1911 domain-containing protein [Pseudomonas fakonensis]|uniref:DUF1911 domain-containing protein n=1 Tax=Pseudomonas fakonensis TaxID=2842355 RepID=A0ABX8MXY7_9PSED|nr:PoNe immunity protein domain-containing protein [Pseudomonas fakonensis]QXH49163.1 DUF1911 domain-containing protein [Pseudomonas fakonensis]